MDFSIFTVFLKNRNIISKIKRSKVTDYAALNMLHTRLCTYLTDYIDMNKPE